MKVFKRIKTQDVAFAYRMGAGFPGVVTRQNPANIEPCAIDAANPPTAYGQAVMDSNQAVGFNISAFSDGIEVYGVTVRPYPMQAASASSDFGAQGFGASAPPVTGVIDVLRIGYITVPVVGTPEKGGPVHIWTSASSGSHVQGGFEAAESVGNTVSILNMQFNNSKDSSGYVEVCIGIRNVPFASAGP